MSNDKIAISSKYLQKTAAISIYEVSDKCLLLLLPDTFDSKYSKASSDKLTLKMKQKPFTYIIVDLSQIYTFSPEAINSVQNLIRFLSTLGIKTLLCGLSDSDKSMVIPEDYIKSITFKRNLKSALGDTV